MLGLAFVAAAVLFNELTIERFLVPDQDLKSPTLRSLIVVSQLSLLAVGLVLLMSKRPLPRTKRSNLMLLASSVLVSLVLAELLARLAFATPTTYRQLLHQNLNGHPMMFPSNTTIKRDMRGLYEGAGQIATLRTDQNRLLLPNEDTPAKHRVLFLGGSTTESFYVPEAQRWVALLNEPGYIATYNAAISGANSADAYFTFLSLTRDGGLQFDFVVLMTMANDFAWQSRLEKYGGSLLIEAYRTYFRDWFDDEMSESYVETLKRQVRLVDLSTRIVSRLDSLWFSLRGHDVESNVVVSYRRLRDDMLSRLADENISLDECLNYEESLSTYRRIELQNLGSLVEAVRNTGAKLLVMSEPSSHKAASGSFFEDFRRPDLCGDGFLTFEDSHSHRLNLSKVYLEAADSVGAMTYDLAAKLDPILSSDEGGRYMYDEMHYTVQGSRKVAETLRPVLREILDESDK